ncbi:MAG: hypothetical protein AAFX94_13020 [Myxococcota bacterium]
MGWLYTVIGLVVLAAVELFIRVFIGFPPLYVEHPTAVYMPLPSSETHYLGVHYTFNSWGMRSAEFELEKPRGVHRVLVLGDDVTFGEGIAQEDLATELLAEMASSGRTLEVLNLAAPGWGPGNVLAYVRKFGLFDADQVIWVARGSDLKDDREFGPLDPYRQPAARAWWYTGFYLGRSLSGPFEKSPSLGDGRGSASALLNELAASGIPTCLVLHPSSAEAASGQPGVDLIALSNLASESAVSITRAEADPNGPNPTLLARSLAGCGL